MTNIIHDFDSCLYSYQRSWSITNKEQLEHMFLYIYFLISIITSSHVNNIVDVLKGIFYFISWIFLRRLFLLKWVFKWSTFSSPNGTKTHISVGTIVIANRKNLIPCAGVFDFLFSLVICAYTSKPKLQNCDKLLILCMKKPLWGEMSKLALVGDTLIK